MKPVCLVIAGNKRQADYWIREQKDSDKVKYVYAYDDSMTRGYRKGTPMVLVGDYTKNPAYDFTYLRHRFELRGVFV